MKPDQTEAPSKPRLSVSFHNFWPGFEAKRHFLTKSLSQTYDIEIVEAGRDVQISSVYRTRRLPAIPNGRPLKVWYSPEALDPRAQIFDLHFGFRPKTSLLGERWFRYPIWITQIDWWDPASPFHVDRLLSQRRMTERTEFCNFIYTNETSIRTEFFMRLNEVRPVASYGRVLNNTGFQPQHKSGKMTVLANSTFTIAFENLLSAGYVTEKLLDPLLAGSVPIYWGPPEAKTDFNSEAFVFAEDFASMQDLVRHVLSLADSRDALNALATAPPFPCNRIPYEHTPDFFVDRVSEALSGPPQPIITDRGPWAPAPGTLRSIERKVRKMRYTLVAKFRNRKRTGQKVKGYSTLETKMIMREPPGIPFVHSPSVSVVVGCFNQAGFVDTALLSVAAQTYSNFDCVIVDDLSTDNSRETIRNTLASLNDSRFRFEPRQTNGGQMASMLAGLDATEGPLVSFLDGDDVWRPNFLDCHVKAHLSRAGGCGYVLFRCRAYRQRRHFAGRQSSQFSQRGSATGEPKRRDFERRRRRR